MKISTPTGALKDALVKIGLPNLVEFEIDDFEYKLMFDHVQKQHPERPQDEQEAFAIARLAWVGYGMPEAASGAKEKLIEDARSREIEGIHTEARSLIRNQFPELRRGIGDGLERVSQAIDTFAPNLMNAVLDSGGRTRNQVQTSTSHLVTMIEACSMRQTMAFEKFTLEFLKLFKCFSFAALLLFLIFLILFFVPRARAQVDCVGFYTSGGALVRNYCAPFRMKEGANITFSASGNTLTITGSGGGGGGTVTSFSAGTLSPLFTTSVATATTTPALSFALSAASADTVFMGSATPSYVAVNNCGSANQALSYNTTTHAWGCQTISTGGAVTSVFTRTGAVTAQSGDYGLGQIGNPAATTSFSYALNQGGTWTFSGAGRFNILGTPLQLGSVGTGTGTLDFFGTTSGNAQISVADAAGTPNKILLPTATGGAGTVLSTDGANPQQLSWIAAGTGTVTSVATTAPITGGTITTTGTIACATCVTSAAALTSPLHVFGQGSQAVATVAYPDIQTFSADGTWTKPTAFTPFEVFVGCVGGGGGGGGGEGQAAPTARQAATGGGGGAFARNTFQAADLPAQVHVLIGNDATNTGGGHGNGGTGAAGSDGTGGGASQFGTAADTGGAGGGVGPFLFVFGGGGGRKGGGGVNLSGGSGGGTGTAGVVGSTGNTTGGAPATAANVIGAGGSGGGSAANSAGRGSEYGGAGGGGVPAVTGGLAGGQSLYAGGGGGGGGGVSAATPGTSANGAAGGSSGVGIVNGGGGAAGTVGAGQNGGSTTVANGLVRMGGGGGGGAGNNAAAGGTGGGGEQPGGGGGGGGGGTNVGGNGGDGGKGKCWVISK